MSEIRCNQCGHEFDLDSATYCPKCGEPLLDELKQRLREQFKVNKVHTLYLVMATIITLVICLAMVDAARHYTWEEPVVASISDKQEHEYTYYINTGTPKSPVMVPMHGTNYYLYLSDGHKEEVQRSVYQEHNVGDNYTYQITHRDWKPGMKDAPTPTWVYMVPMLLLTIVGGIMVYRVMAKRQKEIREWRRTGDLTIQEE